MSSRHMSCTAALCNAALVLIYPAWRDRAARVHHKYLRYHADISRCGVDRHESTGNLAYAGET